MTEMGEGEIRGESERQEEIKREGETQTERKRGWRLQTTNKDLMRIWKVFSPASLPKPPGQPSLHSFHPQLSFQLLKRSGREREEERKKHTRTHAHTHTHTHTLARSQRPSLLISLWGQGVSEGTSPGPDPYSQMYIPLVSGNIPESSPLTGCVSFHTSAPPAPYSYLSTQAWHHTHSQTHVLWLSHSS